MFVIDENRFIAFRLNRKFGALAFMKPLHRLHNFSFSYLLPDKGRSGKQKTGVVRRSGGSPVWGHTFIYKDVSLQELAERGLELTVWDHDRIASNEFLGGVRFNLGTGTHMKHYSKLYI